MQDCGDARPQQRLGEKRGLVTRRSIYLDHHATTPVDERVLAAMQPFFARDFGNAASRTHVFGWRAAAAVEAAREQVAAAVGAPRARDIVFTSGATESNNLAILGALRSRRRGDRVVTVATEHRAVLDPCRALTAEGFSIEVLPVASDGLIDPDAVRRALTPQTALVSVMAANNEIGVLQPLAEIGALCRERGVWFHSDAAQAVGKIPLDVETLHIDLLSLTAHKLYGPKGVGALYVRSRAPRVQLTPLFYGGGHERGLRSGTLPVPLIVGFGCAVEIAAAEREREAVRLSQLRDRLSQTLDRELPEVHLNGHAESRLPGNLNLSFDGVKADAILAELPHLALSAGSACTSASAEPSHVLAALGLSPERRESALRIGLGRSNTLEEIDLAAAELVRVVRALRGHS